MSHWEPKAFTLFNCRRHNLIRLQVAQIFHCCCPLAQVTSCHPQVAHKGEKIHSSFVLTVHYVYFGDNLPSFRSWLIRSSSFLRRVRCPILSGTLLQGIHRNSSHVLFCCTLCDRLVVSACPRELFCANNPQYGCFFSRRHQTWM